MKFDLSYKRILHKMGYFNYQRGLIVRHLNQQEGWDDHLERSRKFILKACELIKPERVTILGSGWLLDIPLTELVEKNVSVVLVDIAHPPEVIEQVKGFKGVEFAEADITGGLAEEIWNKRGGFSLFRSKGNLNDINIPDFTLNFDPGMIVSLNLLSQLDVIPVMFLNRKSVISKDEIMQFRRRIQDNHLNFLKGHPSVLITDYSEVFADSRNNITNVPTIVADLPDGRIKEEWTWNFDLKKSYYYRKKSILKVAAIIL